VERVTGLEIYLMAIRILSARQDRMSDTPLRESFMGIRNGATVFALGSLLVGCDRELTAPTGASADNQQPQLAATAASWALKAPLPKPRSNFKAATVNGVVYAIGGYVFEPATGLQVRARVDAYDVASNTWTQKRSLPEALLPHGATSINGKIYVAGGWTDGRLSKRLYVYDPMTDSWTRKADMPFTIDQHAGHQGMIAGKLYVYAGVTVKADGSPGPHRFFRYDPASNTWATLNRPSYARRGGASAVIGGKLYLVGGTLPTSQNGVGKAYDVHIYDPATGWTKRPLGPYSGGLTYAALGGKLYMVGTESRDGCTYNVSSVYDPVANALSEFPHAPLRERAAGVAAKGQFFVLGGSEPERGDDGCAVGTGKDTGEVWAYTP
jgi:N-acetylneuraminic acid mutarotase